ncbi:MAG: BatA and WFA domain-containing protein [Candidatus Riflebacteria bacterium]|nr:BatA and WFA domain-containing protein [Candidatus Riflebacteria bacterium]
MPFHFGNPWFLLAALGIGVPIYLHLYYRKNPVQKFFPSLRLIRLSSQTILNKMKLKNLILLALRIAVILFLVSALAKPFISTGGNLDSGNGSPSAFVVVLDNSMSMGASHRGISLFNAAKSRALEILDKMGQNDKASVVLMNDPGTVLFQQLSWDKNDLREAIRNTTLGHSGTNVHSALVSALKMILPVKSFKRTIYVISDVTKTAWKTFSESFDLTKIPRDIDLVLIPVGEETAPPNLAVSNLELSAPLVLAGRTAPLLVTVSNFSSSPQKSMLSVFINGDKKHELALDLAPDEKKRVSIPCTFQKEGASHIRASISADSLSADDSRHLAVKVLASQKVLILHPPRFIDGRDSTDDLYLRFALNPLNKKDNPVFNVDRRSEEETSGIDLNQYSSVFLVNIRKLPPEFVKNLSAYLLSGGNVIIFPGSRVDPNWYNTYFFDEPGSSYILPGRLVKRIGNSVAKSFAYQITDIDSAHPAFKFFSSEENGDISRAQIYEFIQIEPLNSAQILGRMSHGLPAVIEESRGQGRVMLFAFNADNSWSNWPMKPTFLPFIHQTVFGMIGRGGLAFDSITPQTPVTLQLKEDGLQEVVLETPGGEKTSLPTRKEGPGLIIVSTSNTDTAGFYRLTAKWKNRTQAQAFAVNPPADESDLERFPINKIPRFISIRQKPGTGNKFGEKITLIREGREVSVPLLWALFLLAMAETFFANKPSGIITRTLTGKWNT